MSSSSPASVPVSTSPVAVGANQPKGSPNKLSENGAKPVLPQQQPPAMAAKPAAPRPIQPLAAQPSAAVPPASASSSMFDLGSMSNISFGSLGSLGSLSSLGMDSTKPGEPMPLPNGGAPTQSAARPPQQQPQSQPQQQRPMAGQPAQQQPRPAQSGAGARPPAPSGQQPLAPLQPHPSAPSSAVPTSGAPVMPQQQQPTQAPGSPSSTSTAVVPASPGSGSDRRVINPVTVPNGQNFVDITEYLNMPQSEAAKKLSIPPSTLSKRWKEAVRNRKWPWRVVCKLDKEIMTLLHNVPQGAPIPEEIEGRLGYLMRKRQEELKPVVIRL